jgi:hypothetical protein
MAHWTGLLRQVVSVESLSQRQWIRGYHKGRVKKRWVTNLPLSFDHRLVDGEPDSRVLACVERVLKNSARGLVWGCRAHVCGICGYDLTSVTMSMHRPIAPDAKTWDDNPRSRQREARAGGMRWDSKGNWCAVRCSIGSPNS